MSDDGPSAARRMAAAFEALKAAYGERLPERIDELCAAAQRLRDAGATELEPARMLAHRLHGTAGSYGFGDVSTVAGELERLFERDPWDPAAWDEVDTFLKQLRTLRGQG